jgi:Flp pilus assembly pilin Flp
MKFLRVFLKGQSGAHPAEYALIFALVTAAIVGVLALPLRI